MVDVFKNSTSKVPMKDEMIVRVSMEESQIAGRKDNLPSQSAQSPQMPITHVPSAFKA